MIKTKAFFLVAGLSAIGCSAAENTGTGGAGGQGSATTSGSGSVSSSSSSAASSSTGSSASSSAVSSSSSSSGAGGAPMCGQMGSDALALQKIYWGDTDPNDVPDKVSGWKQYGFNLDGKVSTGASVDLCQPANNAPKNNVYPDGNNGIDNSFGRNILPIFLGLSASFSDQANAGITTGQYTLIAHIENLKPVQTQGPLVTMIYSTTPLGMAPKFDGTDCWPVAPEGLTKPVDIESSKVVFPMSSVTADHWDSGGDATVMLAIQIMGAPVTLTIHHARLAMDLAPDHKSATGGQLGGVLDTAEFSLVIKQLAGSFDPSLCSGPTIDSILAQIGQASDILADGTQDPAKTCDGISIGLGFKMKPVQVGLIGPVAPPPVNPCP